MRKKPNRPASPKEQQRQLVAIKYLLQVQRLNQKQIAAELDISPHTVGRIMKRHKLAKKAEKAAETALNKPVQYDDSLTAFIARCRLKNKAIYPIIDNVYRQHIAELQKM